MSDFATEPGIRPEAGEIEAARRQPGGWVYRIVGYFAPDESVPPGAVYGAWKVDENGEIVDGFMKNPNYDPTRFPLPDDGGASDDFNNAK